MTKSLYERLGGNAGIAALADTAVELHLANPAVAPRFEGADVPRLKALAAQFFCAGSGGPEVYEGRSMRDAHRKLNIGEHEYFAVMEDMAKAMERHGIPEADRNEVIGVLFSLRGEILRC